MNILGHEIDCSFVYQVDPVKQTSPEHTECYELSFNLRFKDGRNHTVKITNNYEPLTHNGNKYFSTTKRLKAPELLLLQKQRKKDVKTIKKLREDIINEINKTP